MRRFSLSSLALLCVSHAVAADLPPASSYRAPAQVVAERFSWTGIYVGANAGYVWAKQNTATANGAIAGGQIGANYQMGAFVVGVEGDYQWSGLKGTSTISGGGATITETEKADYFATARGRAGFAFDRVLVYATGGGIFTTIKHNGVAVAGLTGSYAANNSATGWTAGGGVEWAFAEHWSAKAEYLYAQFGGSTNLYATTAPNVTIRYSNSVANVARLGVNYRF